MQFKPFEMPHNWKSVTLAENINRMFNVRDAKKVISLLTFVC